MIFFNTLVNRGFRCTRLFHSSQACFVKPTEVTLLTKQKALRIKFDDGASFQLPSELLRVKSPSVEMIDRKGQQKIIAGRRHVGIMSVEPIGNYALRIVFDDLHESGIYTWDYLHKLGSNKLSFAKEYIRKLREKGLSRDPKTTETKKKEST